MLFTSVAFWGFYLSVLVALQINSRTYKSLRLQTLLLLFASYFFYGYWDWRFLGLIIFVSTQTYAAAILIEKFRKYENLFLWASISINLSILFYFKYAGFFVQEFLSSFDLKGGYNLENIILPVGISFYIFQSFTYVFDVYSNRMKTEKDPLKYFTFIAFFPQLVAGPIERASSLLPQFDQLKELKPEVFYDGIKIIIIGLFLKIFIADNMPIGVDLIFSKYQDYNGGTLILGAIGFAIQIYGDFAGYSFISIGVAKIMGFELTKNFNTPYFSTSIQDFWRRWHISLGSFFRDYVYIPLGGGKRSKNIKRRNILITFLASGLWHGANWTFIIWGAIHGALMIFGKAHQMRPNKFWGWLVTMTSVGFLWVLFRSDTLSDFTNYIYIIATNPGIPEVGRGLLPYFLYYFILDLTLLKYSEKGSIWFSSRTLEAFALSFMLILVIGTIHSTSQDFIYFQF